jgi:protein phosphatase
MQELAEVNVDITEGTWEADQWILLCSDGLSDELSPMDIANILQQHTNLTSAVDALLNAALVKGGHDNITLQLIASPLRGHSSNSTFWRWIPALSRHRTADAVIYLAAIALLLGLLVSTIQ